MSIFKKIFKTYSEKEVKRVMPLVEKINGLEEEISKLSDSELRAKTDYFKEQLKNIYTVLGNAFKEDTNNINSGYPILSWQ